MIGWRNNAGEGDGPNLRDVMGAIQKLSVRISALEDFSQRRGKTNYPEFDGGYKPDDYLEWVSQMENLFKFNDVSERRRVKIAASQLTNSAARWWDKICRVRDLEYKEKVRDWDKMKRMMNKRFVPKEFRYSTPNVLNNYGSFQKFPQACELLDPPHVVTSDKEAVNVDMINVQRAYDEPIKSSIATSDPIESTTIGRKIKLGSLWEAFAVKAQTQPFESLLTRAQFIGAIKEMGWCTSLVFRLRDIDRSLVSWNCSRTLITNVHEFLSSSHTRGQNKQLMPNIDTIPISCASEGVLEPNKTNEDKGVLCCKSMSPLDALFEWLIMVSTKRKIHDIKNSWSSSS